MPFLENTLKKNKEIFRANLAKQLIVLSDEVRKYQIDEDLIVYPGSSLLAFSREKAIIYANLANEVRESSKTFFNYYAYAHDLQQIQQFPPEDKLALLNLKNNANTRMNMLVSGWQDYFNQMKPEHADFVADSIFVITNAKGKFVGIFSLGKPSCLKGSPLSESQKFSQEQTLEICTFISSAFRGQGIAPKVLTFIKDNCQSGLVGAASEENIASVKSMQKAGFQMLPFKTLSSPRRNPLLILGTESTMVIASELDKQAVVDEQESEHLGGDPSIPVIPQNARF